MLALALGSGCCCVVWLGSLPCRLVGVCFPSLVALVGLGVLLFLGFLARSSYLCFSVFGGGFPPINILYSVNTWYNSIS